MGWPTVPRPSASVRTELLRALGDHSGEPERASIIDAKHLRLTTGEVGEILLTKLFAGLIPLEPKLPAIYYRVCGFNFQQSRFLPMTTPPARRMKAAELPGLVLGQMWWRYFRKLLPSARDDDAQSAAGL
jgi:hypothetical protein